MRAGPPRGHLNLQLGASRARMAAGQEAHVAYQAAREAETVAFTREVRVQIRIPVGDWTVKLHGRVDGLIEAEGTWKVEEIKSTALGGARLAGCRLEDWPDYERQLQLYVWMLAQEHRSHRIEGELVLVSLADGSRRRFPIEPDPTLSIWVDAQLEGMIEAREDRLAWMQQRRAHPTPWPYASSREGQDEILAVVTEALQQSTPALVEAPTGLGKTIAVLLAAVRHALATERQVFWATTRTTQQPVVEKTLAALREAGLPVRAVFLNARHKVCTNVEAPLDCRPEACRFARAYFEKLREAPVLRDLREGLATRAAIEASALAHEVCPYQLARDLTPMVDVVVGDTNYVFDPGSRLKAAFEEEPERWIVVCDEAHQLVERARAYRSPRVDAAQARAAGDFLEALGPAFAPFAFLARQIEDAIVEAQHQVLGPVRGAEGVAQLDESRWEDLADRVDELALDYALLKAERPEIHEDPWLMLGWQLARFRTVLGEMGEETVPIVTAGRRESVRLCCLDPSGWIGPRIRALGGFVGASATLTPVEFHRDLLGLPVDLVTTSVPSPFPPENQLVVVAPRVSTAYRDRVAHLPAIAEVIEQCTRAVPGNVAVYFPSFALLEAVMARVSLPRRVLQQPRELDEDGRDALLAELQGEPTLLAAVLGGIFAEGVDLPPGALDAVFVVGPAYPPVGLERDLLRGYFDERYEAGFAYASIVPGITRVVQAAGRLIRRPDDRGAIVLLGRRFRFRDVTAVLPRGWNLEFPPDPAERVAGFFEEA